jgi:hypothetical protein
MENPTVRDFLPNQKIPFTTQMDTVITIGGGDPEDLISVKELYAQIGLQIIQLMNRDSTVLPYCAQEFDLYAIAALQILTEEGKSWILGPDGEMLICKSSPDQ